ncbi:MAG: glycosyltransferase family 2 protein [Burkholderiales bacterium]|nr:glycosyltransferase family 2 protein [Burkholderiales bacterium]
MNRVAVVIPHYHAREKLKRCVQHLRRQTYQPIEVFIRDNDHDNVLFTAAVNEGLAKFAFEPDVKYVLVLNQDAYLRPDCVARLVAFMEATPQCGIACPLQVGEPGTDGVAKVTWGGSLRAFPFGVHRNLGLSSYGDPQETYWANGAAMLIRTATIREIGVFDRNLRFICSDSDYSFTARARGWKVFLVPAAVAEHTITSSHAPNEALAQVMIKDALYFARKWLSGDLYRSLAVEGAELTEQAVRKHMAEMMATLQALEGGARLMPPKG